MTEPLIHSHITDELPDDHPLAWQQVYCDGKPEGRDPRGCRDLLHAGNNESMTTWIETGRGNFCVRCFVALVCEDVDSEGEPYCVLDERWALPGGTS